MKPRPLLLDIFCTVIDNYGDIGVTWRLARQLAREFEVQVRLWVDDLESFRHIQPEVDAADDPQSLLGVEIRHWIPGPLPVPPGDVVIEALACNLPDSYIQAMAELSPPPVWINLEYLSAESWVSGVHGLPSPHPRLPLTKYFFMPGYEPGTGGLTRESNLFQRRDDHSEQAEKFLTNLGVPAAHLHSLRISLFSYESRNLSGWLHALAGGNHPVLLIAPKGKTTPEIAAWAGLAELDPGAFLSRNGLAILIPPMLPLDDYDRLLWSCDLNFVRGEDSFVRAQWAARPLVWQAYRQAENAHMDKLAAFLDRYCRLLPPREAAITRRFWEAWNREEEVADLWPDFAQSLPVQAEHARVWAAQLAREPHQAANLMKFINKLLECSAF